MDKTWDRKSFEVVGRCCGNEKNTQIRQKSNAKKKKEKLFVCFFGAGRVDIWKSVMHVSCI